MAIKLNAKLSQTYRHWITWLCSQSLKS